MNPTPSPKEGAPMLSDLLTHTWDRRGRGRKEAYKLAANIKKGTQTLYCRPKTIRIFKFVKLIE